MGTRRIVGPAPPFGYVTHVRARARLCLLQTVQTGFSESEDSAVRTSVCGESVSVLLRWLTQKQFAFAFFLQFVPTIERWTYIIPWVQLPLVTPSWLWPSEMWQKDLWNTKVVDGKVSNIDKSADFCLWKFGQFTFLVRQWQWQCENSAKQKRVFPDIISTSLDNLCTVNRPLVGETDRQSVQLGFFSRQETHFFRREKNGIRVTVTGGRALPLLLLLLSSVFLYQN